MRGAGGYIIGEKLRSGSEEVRAALSRQGRYATVKDNLQVKEVKIGSDDRFVLCFNPTRAERDAAIRARLVAQLEEAIKDTDTLSKTGRARTEGALSAAKGIKRFLRVTPGGLLRVDRKVAAEANLDGKYLLRCSDPHLSAEDIALGYKQLLEVERGWRDMKQILDLRPVYHRREDRIRAHILLCWLALLLTRVAENTSGWTWKQIRTEASRIHAVTFTGPAGTFRRATELTKPSATCSPPWQSTRPSESRTSPQPPDQRKHPSQPSVSPTTRLDTRPRAGKPPIPAAQTAYSWTRGHLQLWNAGFRHVFWHDQACAWRQRLIASAILGTSSRKVTQTSS